MSILLTFGLSDRARHGETEIYCASHAPGAELRENLKVSETSDSKSPDFSKKKRDGNYST